MSMPMLFFPKRKVPIRWKAGANFNCSFPAAFRCLRFVRQLKSFMKQRGSLLAAFLSKDDDEESGKEEPSCMTEFFAQMRRLRCLATARQAESTHMFIAAIAVDKAIYVRSVSLTNHPEGSERAS